MALTTTTTSSPNAGSGDVIGDGADAFGVRNRGPTELLYHQRHGAQGYRDGSHVRRGKDTRHLGGPGAAT